MIYFTSLSDTPSSIACDLLGGVDYGDTLADSIRSINKNSMAARNQLGSYYAPNRPIWIPGFSSMPEYGPIIERIINRLDTLPSNSRMQLAMAMSRGQDLNPMMGASKAIDQNNQDNGSKASLITTTLAGKTVIESSSRSIERAANQAEHFSAAMEKLNEATKLAAEAHKLHGPKSEAFKTLKSGLHEQHRETVHILNKRAKLFSKRMSAKATKHIRSAKTELRMARKKGIYISDLDDVSRIDSIARYGKIASRSMFAFSIALGVDEVYETYEDGGDAFAKSVRIGLEIGGAYALGEGLILAFTPAGWVALASLAIVEGATLALGGAYIENGGEKIAKYLEHLYQWVKKSLTYWL